jgi:hypothetical protein
MLYWFPCDACSKYFPSEFTLMKHKRISHPSSARKPRLLCDFCSTTHCDSSSLYRHVNKKHKVCGNFWQTGVDVIITIFSNFLAKKWRFSQKPML